MSLNSRIMSVVQPLFAGNQRSQQVQNEAMRNNQSFLGTIKTVSSEQLTADMGGGSIQNGFVGNSPMRVNDPVILIGGRAFQ